ncbi:hypothetical protein CCR75_005975 [Bremia lactucae]|uniref:RING-type domain-containing protein n=1 Tax=Bremia lactucae TaxID=4779 RepID=A0A976FHU3_BRELC|nr:hypothetical protein CCR75_005975 [Bremia lactucae]
MFLRSLYGSRMPQPLHPRVDPQASSYWEEDTASSREISRTMEEADAQNSENHNNGKKIDSVLAALAADEHTCRNHSIPTMSSQLGLLVGMDGALLDDVDGLSVEDMIASPFSAQLSPAGLISIAAADIDEVAANSSPPVNGQLDLAFIRSLRRSSSDMKTELVNEALRKVMGPLPATQRPENESPAMESEDKDSKHHFFSLVRRHLNMLGSASFSAATPENEVEVDATESQTKLRFLSLLRRINELHSQQVHTESWDGLPYPQIIALPTFKYQVREHHGRGSQLDKGGEENNTVCAVCRDEFKAEEEVRALPCLHFYHRECIDQWLMYHRQCPICKHVIAVY